MKEIFYVFVTCVAVIFLTPLLLNIFSPPKKRVQIDKDTLFSTNLYPKFQARACTKCHDFYEKKLNGLSFTTHKKRVAERCIECHKQKVTGFQHPGDWQAQPGLYTSGMNAKQTCEAIKRSMKAQFKSKKILARDFVKHVFGSPRVKWGIEGATPQSGRLPEELMSGELLQGGFEKLKAEVQAWVEGGMICK
ncbi:MAG: hypothetical protein ISR65_20590 [Bacteriovoracaceae bacterium]|nr:hypothetical protein [Bacteriovoracaceae bacterium]